MKKFMNRSSIACILAVTMAVSLTSCGPKGKPTANNNPAGETASSANVTAAGQLPIVKDKISLNIGIPGSVNIQDFETNEYTKWLEEKTNIDLNFTVFPDADSTSKLKIMLASNSELPEVLMNFTLGDDITVGYSSQNVFLPINDYLPKYGYWVNQMLEKSILKDVQKYLVAADGKMYFMPYLVEQTGNIWSGKAWINKVWLDKLGLKVPETTDEFYEALKAFKTRDANGNGKQDEIGFTGSKTGFNEIPFDFLFNAFTYADKNNYYLVNGGKLEAAYDKDEWKDALKYMNKLASEGLYDYQSFTQDNKTLKTLAQNPDVNLLGAFVSGGIDGLYNTLKSRMGEYVALPPLKGPKGVQYSYKQPLTPRPSGYITKYCKNPEAAFRLMDFMLSEESALRARYGVPGKDWKEAKADDKGMFESIGRKAKVLPILPYGTPQNSHWLSLHPVFRSVEVSDGMVWDGDPLNGEYVKAKALPVYMDKGPAEIVSKQLFTVKESEEFTELRNNIYPYVKENIASFILGGKNLDSDWDNYKKELEKMNLKRFIELSQIGYDRFMSQK